MMVRRWALTKEARTSTVRIVYAEEVYNTICILNSKPQKLVDGFTYHGRNISSTEKIENIRIEKEWNAIDHGGIQSFW